MSKTTINTGNTTGGLGFYGALILVMVTLYFTGHLDDEPWFNRQTLDEALTLAVALFRMLAELAVLAALVLTAVILARRFWPSGWWPRKEEER